MTGYEFGLLLAATALPALALAMALAAAWNRDPLLGERLRAAALWTVCGLALAASSAAITGSAETMNLGNVVLAQENTQLYALFQPAAAAVFLMSLVLASERAALVAVIGDSRPARVAAMLLALPACALGAMLFLGGTAGPALPGAAWLALKTLVVMGLLLLARPRFAALRAGPRFAIAWLACLVALINLAITVGRAAL